jgi:hypothetical protein
MNPHEARAAREKVCRPALHSALSRFSRSDRNDEAVNTAEGGEIGQNAKGIQGASSSVVK